MNIKKFRKILEQEFPQSYFEREIPEEFIDGTFVWNGFQNMSMDERQKLFREKIKNNLDEQEFSSIRMILTFTGDEYKNMMQENE